MKINTLFNNHPQLYGFLLVTVATTLFSCKAILIKLAYQYGGVPDVVISLRMAFSFPFYLAVAIYARHTLQQPLTLANIGFITAIGITGYYVASVFDLYGLQYITASLERLVLYIYPTLVIILSAIFLGAPIKRIYIVCMAMIYSGLVIVFLHDTTMASGTTVNTVLGDMPELYFGGLLVFISAIAFAVYLIGGEFIMRKLSSQLFTAYAMLAACAAIAIHFAIKQPLTALFNQSFEVYLTSLMIAVFSTVLPSFMLSAGIKAAGASTAGIIGSLGPVFTLGLSALILGKQLSALQLVGFVIVMGGVIWLGKFK